MDTIGIKELRRTLTTVADDIFLRRITGVVLTSNGVAKAALLPVDRSGVPLISSSLDEIVIEECPEGDGS